MCLKLKEDVEELSCFRQSGNKNASLQKQFVPDEKDIEDKEDNDGDF